MHNKKTSLCVVLQHYEAVMRYVSQGPLLVDVHMHKPEAVSRNFMDSLLAFWPGLQVIKQPLIKCFYLASSSKLFNFTFSFSLHTGNGIGG